MGRILVRLAGIALIVAGVAGLVFSVGGIVVVGRVERQIQTAAMEQLDLIDRMLSTTAEGLALAETSLAQAVDTVGSLETTMAGVGQAVEDSVPMVNSVAELLGEQLPATIAATQDTLRSVAQSAQLVDDLLAVLTSIPFLGLERYNPEVPLYQGLADVADSLNDVPQSLVNAQGGMITAGSNLEELKGELDVMAAGVGGIATSLEGTGEVLAAYQDVVVDLQGLVDTVRRGLPQWLRWLRLAVSLALAWLGVAQIALLTQGWELVGRSRPPAPEGGQPPP
jgi:hypothetical protein